MTWGLAREFLPWLLPPVGGALLGFLLGFLAFGRLARTALLRNRTRISRSISEQAGALGSRLLAMRAASVVPLAGSPSARKVEDTLAGMLTAILGSRGTIYAVRDAVGKLASGLAARAVGETADRLGIEGLLSEKILAALGAPSNRASIAAAAGRLVAEQAGTAIDDDVIRELSGVVDSAVPEAAQAAVRWLRSEETRDYLSQRGRELLPRILEKLTELQKLFLTAAQLDRRLNEKMPEIVDETVIALEKMVRDPRQQKRAVAVFSDAARDWRDSLLVSPAGPGRPWNERQQKLADSVATLVDRFLSRLEDPEERRVLAGRATGQLDRERRPLGAFLRDVAGLTEQDIVELISDRVLRVLTSPETARDFAARLYGLVQSRAGEGDGASIASVLGIDESRRQELEAAIRSAVPAAVEREIPALLAAPAGRRGIDLLLGALGAAAGLATGLVMLLLHFLGIA